jgi:hypothetical protein
LPHLQFVKNPHSPFEIPKELEAIKRREKSQFHVKSVSVMGCLPPHVKSSFDISPYLEKCGLKADVVRIHTQTRNIQILK